MPRKRRPTHLRNLFTCDLYYYIKDSENLRKQSGETEQARIEKWEAPPEDIYKINIDVAFTEATGRGE